MLNFKKDDTQLHQILDVYDVLDNFPFPEFRLYQKDKIEEITAAFNSGYKWILLETPTGFGKSPLRVGRRLKELHHNRWYAVQTLKIIVQAYGRAVRSPIDQASFYIIDSDVNRICKRWHRQLPRFFMQAYDAKEKLL